MSFAASHVAVALMTFGVTLHSVTHGVLASAFHPGYWLWSMLPYLVAALAYRRWLSARATACALVLPACADAVVFHGVFIAPVASTAAVGLIVMPFWNLVVLLPLGAAVGWFWDRRRMRQ